MLKEYVRMFSYLPQVHLILLIHHLTLPSSCILGTTVLLSGQGHLRY